MTDDEVKILRALRDYQNTYPHASMDEEEIAEAIGLDTANTRVHPELMRSHGWVKLTRFGVMEVRVLVSRTRGAIPMAAGFSPKIPAKWDATGQFLQRVLPEKPTDEEGASNDDGEVHLAFQ